MTTVTDVIGSWSPRNMRETSRYKSEIRDRDSLTVVNTINKTTLEAIFGTTREKMARMAMHEHNEKEKKQVMISDTCVAAW